MLAIRCLAFIGTGIFSIPCLWKENCNKLEYRNIEICLLRNLPKTGVGMFTRSGFYPDFIFWIRNKKTKAVRVVFLDPHGLHHEGAIDNEQFAAIEKLRE